LATSVEELAKIRLFSEVRLRISDFLSVICGVTVFGGSKSRFMISSFSEGIGFVAPV